MKNTRMPMGRLFFVCLLSLSLLAQGCTFQRQYKFTAPGMPEEIFISTPFPDDYSPDIAIFPFTAPAHEQQVGRTAAQFLYTELLKKGIRANFTFHGTASFTDPEQLGGLAIENNYDYVVTGKVLHYLNGGISTDSRAEAQMIIYTVANRELEMAGYAKAVETARPLHDIDFIVAEGRGTPAPSAELLMQRNAVKFANMMAEMLDGTPER